MSTIAQILDRKGRTVVSISEQATVLDAARAMNEAHIGAVVVTRGEKVIGIFSERDILNRVVAQERLPADVLVREVMTSPVACCSPSTKRGECRQVMKSRRIRHLPVVDDDDHLVGIVSIGDLLEDAVAEDEDTIRYLYEYMHASR